MKVSTNIAPDTMARQIEFPLSVAVCAWCKPKSGQASLTVLSHGICPRHMRMMRSKVKAKSAALN
jgi:hypothetical protein